MNRRITFTPGETQCSILVDILQDDIAELQEDFIAVLSNASEGLIVGSQNTATATIADDDCKFM